MNLKELISQLKVAEISIKKAELSNADKKMLDSRVNEIYAKVKQDKVKDTDKKQYDMFVSKIHSLKKSLNKSPVQRSNKFVNILNYIKTGSDLELYLNTWKEKYPEDVVEVELQDFMQLWLKLAKYHKNEFDLEAESKKDEAGIEAVANETILVYKHYYKNRKLSPDDLEKMRLCVNIILISLGYLSLNKSGTNMSQENAMKFYETIYEKFEAEFEFELEEILEF